MQPLVHPTMDRVPLKGGPPGAPVSAVVVEEGLPCLTQLAIWSALLLGVAGTALGAAGFAFSQQNKGLIEEYVYSPPAAPPSSLLGGDHCLESVFMDLKAREVQLWTPAPAGGAASGVSWVSPVVYVVEGGQTTTQAQRVSQQGVGNLLQLLKSINTFLPSFTPSSVLSGEVTALYTPTAVNAPPSTTGKMAFPLGFTQLTSAIAVNPGIPVTLAARLYLAPTVTEIATPTVIDFTVQEQLQSALGVRKIESYKSGKTTPTVNLYLEVDATWSESGISMEIAAFKTKWPYSIQLSGRRLPNGKILHGVKLQPMDIVEEVKVTGSGSEVRVEKDLLAANLPSFYWELEEEARCGLAG